MELRVLRYFLGVAEAGGMTRAARRLHVTQPTLSRQLRELEEELGRKLFIRGSHSLTLTPEGMLLRRRAEEILGMVRKTESEFSAAGSEVVGEVCIGGGETEAMRRIARLVCEVRREYPGIRFHLFSGNAEDVTERLDKGMLDFGILIQPVDLGKYEFADLPDKDRWGVVMRRDSPLARQRSVSREDLLGKPLIFSRQVMRRLAEENEYSAWFGAGRDRLNVVATYNLIYNAALMVEEGVGYAVTLDRLLHLTGRGTLCFRPLTPRLESGLNIVWKRNAPFSTAGRIFLERIQNSFDPAGAQE